MMMGFVGILVLAVGVFFVVVIASSGGGDDESPAGSSTPRPDDGSNEPRTGGSGICSGDILYTFGADPATILDPIQVRDEGTAEYVVEIFGGLVSLDLDLNVIPDIAESWEILDGGTTYVFHLRDDVPQGRPPCHSGRR